LEQLIQNFDQSADLLLAIARGGAGPEQCFAIKPGFPSPDVQQKRVDVVGNLRTPRQNTSFGLRACGLGKVSYKRDHIL
jgi:hypothetical protein